MKSHKISKARKGAWFVKVRGSYLPASWQGWLTYIPYIFLVLIGFSTVLQPVRDCAKFECSTGTAMQMLSVGVIILVPYLVSLVVVMQWIAKQKS